MSLFCDIKPLKHSYSLSLHPCLGKALEVCLRKVCGCAGTSEATTPLTEVLPQPECLP